ncbi:glycerate kinase, partial [Bacillus velezensis]
MKIIIAPDSFKESMTSKEAADSIEKGFKAVFPDAEYIK